MAVSSIARGRVTALDVAAAKAHPGVVEVMTPANAPKLARHPDDGGDPFTFKLDLLQDDQRALRQPADRGGDRRNAGGGDRGRGAAQPVLRRRSPPASASMTPSMFVPPTVGFGEEPETARGDVEAGLAVGRQADRRDLRNAGAVPQRDGDPRHRRGVGRRRQAGCGHAEPGHVDRPGPHRRPVRHRPRRHPRPQPVPRRRLRLQGRGLVAAGSGDHGSPPGRAAGQAGHPPRPDVRPGRPSRAHPPDPAPRRRRRRGAHRHRPPHAHHIQHLR